MRYFVLCFALVLSLALPAQAAPLKAMASIGPVKYLVDRIGGDLVQTEVLVAPGASPATYEPKPRQMAALAESTLFFAVGVPFERTWLPRISSANPKLIIVHTDAGIKKLAMAAHHHDGDEDHGERGDHETMHEQHVADGTADAHHGIPDPHIWTAPPLYRTMADNVLSGLILADPAHKDVYLANHKGLVADIAALDAELRKLFTPFEGASFMVYHPAWGYFAHAYGLEQIPVELEGKEPGPRELAGFIRLAKEKAVKAIFVQPQFSRKSATAIAGAVGATVIPIDPLAKDWLPGLKRAAALLRSGLR